MGCCGNTERSTLPIVTIGTQSAGAKASRSGSNPSKTKQTRVIIDFHCPTCGVTKPGYPNYSHQCPGPSPVGYQIERQIICDACEHNVEGVCVPLTTIQPGKPCLVDVGIPMPEVECPLKRWRRVLFKCDKCGSVRFGENGLTECPTCRPPSKLKTAFISNITDQPVQPESDLAIISIATGQNATDLAKTTFPRFQEYANFVGADFIEVRNNKYPRYPLANKFRVGAIVAKYRRVLFLDVDIWLRSDVGNIFEIFESGSIWMHPDVDMINGHSWALAQTEKIRTDQGIVPNPSKAHNTGVVLFDQDHCGIWSPPPQPISTGHVSEQFWIEHQAMDMGVKELPWEYNCQWYWPDFRQREPEAKVVHLANCPHTERMTRLRRLRNNDADFA